MFFNRFIHLPGLHHNIVLDIVHLWTHFNNPAALNCYHRLDTEIASVLGFGVNSSVLRTQCLGNHTLEKALTMVTRPQCGIYYSVCVDSMSYMNGHTRRALSEESD